MLGGSPQLCGSLMSPDTVQCPLRWGGGRSITLERVNLASGREFTQAPQRLSEDTSQKSPWELHPGGWDSAPSPVGRPSGHS